ncbi:hypothetical protein QBC33DRAFT_533544, partial [Phialemonium atrogriseum]
SPQGHGLCIASFADAAAAADHLPGARAVVRAMARSIVWGDFALVCRDVSGSVVGTWRRGGGTDTGGGGEEEGKRRADEEAEVYVFDGGSGRFSYDRSARGGGPEAEAGLGLDHTGGSFQVFEYENGVCHLVLTEDDPGRQSAGVWVVERGEGELVVEGKKYLRV